MGAPLSSNQPPPSNVMQQLVQQRQADAAQHAQGTDATQAAHAHTGTGSSTITSLKGQQSFTKSQIPPATNPKLPFSSATVDMASSGNPWLNVGNIVAFESAMMERAKIQQQTEFASTKSAIVTQKSIQETGQDKANSQMTEGTEEAFQYGVSAATSAGQAVNSASTLADRQSVMDEAKEEADPTSEMGDKQKAEYKQLDDQIKSIRDDKNSYEQNVGGANKNDVDQGKMTPEAQKEIQDLEQRKQDLVEDSGKEMKSSKQISKEKHDKLATIEAKSQMINSALQAVDQGNHAVMTLLITKEKMRQTMDDTTNQMNQAYLEAQQKASQRSKDDFDAAVQSLGDYSKQRVQSIKFTAA